jgi:8-amino-7-oxononanoate synthase
MMPHNRAATSPFQLAEALQTRREEGLFRTRSAVTSAPGAQIGVDGQRYLNFASNDYLGLANHPDLKLAWQDGAAIWGSGSAASPLVTGYSAVHAELERELADWLGVEAVMLFSSGFSANQAVIKTLLHKEHLQWHDRLNHASLQEAAAHSPARMKRFRHNDMAHLTELLEPSRGLIISEGVFSMDGDEAPCAALSQLARDSGNWLMLDEAHSFGVLGQQGRGVLSAQQIPPDACQIRVVTFGKALGVAGAMVGGSQEFIDYMVNFSRDYIYSTHMPAAQAYVVLAALHLVQQADPARAHLQQMIQRFRVSAQTLGLSITESQTSIQPILIGDPEQTMALAVRLRHRNIWVGAMRPPTVPRDTSRLRVTITAAHTAADIDCLLHALDTCRHG